MLRLRRKARPKPDFVAAGLGAPEYFSLRRELNRVRLMIAAALAALFPMPVRRAWRRRVSPFAAWIWARRWGRVLTRSFGYFWTVAVIGLICGPIANAQGGVGIAGQGSFLSGFALVDYQNFNAAAYRVTVDKGGTTDMLGKGLASTLIELEFGIYQSVAIMAIWAMKFALTLEWVQWLAQPFVAMGEAVSKMTADLDLVPMMALAAAIMITWTLISGRFSTGIYDLVVSAIIAALAAGALKNPVGAVIGDNGLLMSARNIGVKVAVGLAHRGDTSGKVDSLLEDMSKSLVWSMIRIPAQTFSFGKPLDKTDIGQNGTPGNDGTCVSEYNNAMQNINKKTTGQKVNDAIHGAVESVPLVGDLASGALSLGQSATGTKPDSPNDKVWKAVKKCNEDLGSFAESTGYTQVVGLLFLIIGGFILFAFGGYLAMRVIIAAVTGIIASIMAIPRIIAAIVPAWRNGFFKNVSNVVMAMGQIMAAIVFLGAYMAMLRALFVLGDGGLIKAMFMMDIALIAGLVYFHKMMSQVKQWSNRLNDALQRKPAAEPVKLKKPTLAGAVKGYAADKAGRYAVDKLGQRTGRALSRNNGPQGSPPNANQPGGPKPPPPALPPGTGGRPTPVLPGGPGAPGGAAVGGAQQGGQPQQPGGRPGTPAQPGSAQQLAPTAAAQNGKPPTATGPDPAATRRTLEAAARGGDGPGSGRIPPKAPTHAAAANPGVKPPAPTSPPQVPATPPTKASDGSQDNRELVKALQDLAQAHRDGTQRLAQGFQASSVNVERAIQASGQDVVRASNSNASAVRGAVDDSASRVSRAVDSNASTVRGAVAASSSATVAGVRGAMKAAPVNRGADRLAAAVAVSAAAQAAQAKETRKAAQRTAENTQALERSTRAKQGRK